MSTDTKAAGMTVEEVAELLGVHQTTVSGYARGGLITRTRVMDRAGSRFMYDAGSVLRFDERYPMTATGRRALPNRRIRVDRNIEKRITARGRVAYYVDLVVNGQRYSRAFGQIGEATAYRDLIRSQARAGVKVAQEGKSPQATPHKRDGLFRRLRDRMNARQWETA